MPRIVYIHKTGKHSDIRQYEGTKILLSHIDFNAVLKSMGIAIVPYSVEDVKSGNYERGVNKLYNIFHNYNFSSHEAKLK